MALQVRLQEGDIVSGTKEALCNHCGFPVRKGILPIIHPSSQGHCKAYCCVACFEAVAGKQMPEPLRSWHLEVEQSSGV